jgi:hypothetical protein
MAAAAVALYGAVRMMWDCWGSAVVRGGRMTGYGRCLLWWSASLGVSFMLGEDLCWGFLM